ncbi:putative glycosyltransferase [Gordonia araii NBRC 100433]|uniref:Putative glycosyltransferase n=1 Tax=Gordonia araii NBRC 100433 TaxID=1073574 RepID=G7H0E2_9ACTN|nr:nucleotide disphospho-sugar-binding domain-containing protein [Gordonia araii]NNG96919.1 glycosyl transferase [Gordonia araii NBRC 100433]GAB09317.1 putative glycosyltransferase [Gordonia araii NBRC 100433]
MRVAVVAGDEAGHAFPAFALAERLAAAGHEATVFTGTRWSGAALTGGEVAELPGLAAADDDDDADAGAKLSTRAARMALLLAPRLCGRFDVVVSDIITRAGAWGAELAGLPWAELSPHPLYDQSRGLPPIGMGLAAGRGGVGRLRDRALRAMSARAIASGARQREQARASIGLTVAERPVARLVATLPALEVRRPDWPADAHLVGPLLWEPTRELFDVGQTPDPLVVVAPSTAVTGQGGLADGALRGLGVNVLGRPVRVVLSGLHLPSVRELRDGAGSGIAELVAGTGRQDEVLARASAAVCGAGHGMLAKALGAGVPVVMVPGGGDQQELAARVERLGAGVTVREPDPARIADAVRRVLDEPGFATAARRVAASGASVVDPVAVVQRAVSDRLS